MTNPLHIGDIIVFKPQPDDWFGKCIAMITNSDASHAAMVYSNNSMIELGAPGIAVNNYFIAPGDNNYILRMKNNKSPAPLKTAADKYLKAKVRYDFPGILILAGLLIHRSFVPTRELISVSNKILLAACLELDKFAQLLLGHTDRPMICSQLVYQIYEDCGKDYKIEIIDGNLWSSNADSDAKNLIRLIDFIPEKIIGVANTDFVSDFNANTIEFLDLAKELYHAFLVSDSLPAFELDEYNDILYYAQIFLTKLKGLLDKLKLGIPVDALFVTPADLVYHTSNLRIAGTLNITRNIKNNQKFKTSLF